MDNDIILSKLINDIVMGIYQTWFPTLLVDSFLTVQIMGIKKRVEHTNNHENLNTILLQGRIDPTIGG